MSDNNIDISDFSCAKLGKGLSGVAPITTERK
jgi:hypothetical protein